MCAVLMTSFKIGIGMTCLVEVIFIIFLLYVASFTLELLEDAKPNIDQLILKRAWLKSKNDYVTSKRNWNSWLCGYLWSDLNKVRSARNSYLKS